jgi:rfaE bifunctional protein nucleotidyltransferase chain/domain
MRAPRDKLLSGSTLVRRFARPRPVRLAFTNGCFDILHRGHVEYLSYARSLADVLVVAVNSDASVRRLKGHDRPLNPAEDRAIVLAGLESVDWVTIFTEDTPATLIADLLPDLLVKGGDYAPEQIVGADAVRGAGGTVVVAPLIPGRSTSTLIQRSRATIDDRSDPT